MRRSASACRDRDSRQEVGTPSASTVVAHVAWRRAVGEADCLRRVGGGRRQEAEAGGGGPGSRCPPWPRRARRLRGWWPRTTAGGGVDRRRHRRTRTAAGGGKGEPATAWTCRRCGPSQASTAHHVKGRPAASPLEV